MSMKTVHCVLAILLLNASLVLCAAAADAPVATPRPVSPMMAEITTAVTASQAAVAELSRGLATAVDQEAVLAIQRESARLKQEARLETFRIQMRYAAAEGRTEAVTRLERLLSDLTTPRAAGIPQRPAPATAGGR
jgi:hypothetical protein